jgi:GPH family glycoside/pentoside/hexuronide:cation symporter
MALPESSAAAASVVDLVGRETSEPVTPHQPLSVRSKIFFAVGDTMDGFNTTAVGTVRLFALTAVCGLSGSLAGASGFISLMIDGFIDPLIGSLSDNWHSRLGRRHPFLFASILPLVLTLGLTFSVPRALTGFWLFSYATVVILTMRIAYSAFSLPFLALGAELTGDYVERSRLIVYRVFFNTMANLLTTFLGYRVFMAGNNGLLNRAAYIPFGWSVAIMMGIGMLICAFGTLDQRYRLHSPGQSSAHIARRLIAEVVEIFRSRSFVVLFSVVLLFWISQGSAAVLALHAAKFFWKLPNEIIQYQAISIAMGGLAGIPVAGLIARIFEKRTVVAWTLIVNCAQQGVLPLMRITHLLPTNGPLLYGILIVSIFTVGLSGAISGIFFQSMMADATDEHELLFGSRREGLYFAGITLSAKAALAVGALIGGVALDAIGFPRDLSQNISLALNLPRSAVVELGIVSGPLPAIISVVTLVLLLAYRIDHARQVRISQELARRRANPNDIGSSE